MLYNIFLGDYAYLCTVIENNRLRNAETQTKTIMEKNVNEILMLRYQIKRYQAMRKGAMCQALNSKLQKLLAQQAQAL